MKKEIIGQMQKFEPSIIPNQPINNFHQQQYYQKPHTQQSQSFHQPLLYQQITQFQQLTTFQATIIIIHTGSVSSNKCFN